MANLATINNNLLADSGIDPLSVVLGTGTANQIAYWVDADNVGALTTATYPSLTELSYVKGVTSSIQTQLNAKLNLSGGTLTGALNGTIASFSSTGSGVFNSIIKAVNTTTADSLIEFSNTANGFCFGFSSTGAKGQRFVFINGAPTEIGYITAAGDAVFNSFVKSGGTAAQILAADGTVITAGTNITISGGSISAADIGFANPMTTLGDIIYGAASGTATRLAGNITTTKQYLSQTGNGTASAAPAWATIAGSDITGAALTKTDDTNVTLTLGGTPATALLRAASLTLGWTGQLSVARGGTGAASYPAGQILYGNGTSAIASSATFTYTPTSAHLINNSVTAASAIARGVNITSTLVAAANNDVLVGLNIAPTFTNGAFTGVTNTALSVVGTSNFKDTITLEASNSTNKWWLYNYTDNSLRFNYNGSGNDEFILDTAGGLLLPGFAVNQNPSSAGTSQTFTRYVNTGGDTYIGLEGSVAGGFFGGSQAYDSVYWSSTAANFIIGGISRLRITTSGFLGINQSTPNNFIHITSGSATVGGTQITLEGSANGYGAGFNAASRTSAGGTLVQMGKVVFDGEGLWNTTASTQDAYYSVWVAQDGSLIQRQVIGSDGSVYFGNGFSSASPLIATLRATNGQGTNVAGAEFRIVGGVGTGTGVGGAITFYTAAAGASGATLNTASERMMITQGGSVGISVTPGNFNGLTFTGPFLDVAGVIQIKGTSANTVAALQLGGDTYRKAIISSTIGTEAPALIFGVASTGNNSATTERMRITSTGALVVGNGESSATPSLGLIEGTDGSGTNIAGAELRIQGGQSTGTGVGGAITFYTAAAGGTSGSTLNTAAEKMRIAADGTVRMNQYTTNGLVYTSGANGTLNAAARTINGVTFNGSTNITITASTTAALTFNNGGAGAASGTTFDGGTARTISYNTIGAQPLLTNPITGDGTEAAGNISYFTGNTSIAGNASLFWDTTNSRLGVGTNTPNLSLDVRGNTTLGGGATATSLQHGLDGNARYLMVSGSGANANYGFVWVVNNVAETTGALMGGYAFGQLVSSKTGTNAGTKAAISGFTSGSGGTVGGFGGEMRFYTRPDNAANDIGSYERMRIDSAGTVTTYGALTTGGNVNIPNGSYYRANRSTGSATISCLGFASGSDTLSITGGTSGASTSIKFADTGGDIAGFYNGNFGVGTIAPSTAKLVVYGSAAAAANVTLLNLENGSDGGVKINFRNSVASELASITAGVTGTGAGTDDGILIFNTSTNATASEKMRITNNGTIQILSNTWIQSNNIGLVRDSYFGYSTSYRTVQVGGGSVALGVDLTANASGNFTGNEIVIPNNRGIIAPNNANNNYLGIIKATSSDGINIGGNYTVDGWINILNNGNVGIGTASPGQKLTVYSDTNGDARLSLSNPNAGASARTFLYSISTGNRYVGMLAYGASATGTTLGLSNASLGILEGGGDLSNFLINSTSTIVFGVNSSQRMRIATDGNVLIGETSSSTSRLVVRKDAAGARGGEISIVNYAASTLNSSAALNFGLEASTYDADNGNAQIKAQITTAANSASDLIFSTWNGTAFGERFRIASAGAATFSSSVTASSFFEPSDIRLKEIIERNPSVYLDIDLVKYKKKDRDGIRYGYIAQEVKALIPELAEGDDILSLNYQDIHSIKIAALENQIKELKEQLKQIK